MAEDAAAKRHVNRRLSYIKDQCPQPVYSTNMNDPGLVLLNLCNAARQEGADFPTIWNGMLKGNGIVAGVPGARSTPFGPVVEVPLTTGEHLEFGPRGFSLRDAAAR